VFPADQREQALAYAETLATRGRVSAEESISLTPDFQPGSTFTAAPRLQYVPAHQASYQEQFQHDEGAVEREFTALKSQLLTVPGAVSDVPDGWGGTTKRVDLTKLSARQADDYLEYVKLSLER